jgi:CRP-like cAMP-binding protein
MGIQTPKQFEMIHRKAQVLEVKKGTCLVRNDEELKHVFLVVKGSTRASILGRFLTAASTTPTAHQERVGGARHVYKFWVVVVLCGACLVPHHLHFSVLSSFSCAALYFCFSFICGRLGLICSGAWIGEMAFLEHAWLKEQGIVRGESKAKSTLSKQTSSGGTEKSPPVPVTGTEKKDKASLATKRSQTPQTAPRAMRSMYTIIADDDCIVLRWSQEDMESLFERSIDMRAGLTRAMTAAVVGKVINFTVSRSSGKASWSTWLDDWTGAKVKIEKEDDAKKDADDDEAALLAKEEESKEKLPHYPIKSFR